MAEFFLNGRRIKTLRRTHWFWRMSRGITISFSLHKYCLQSDLELLKSIVDLELFVTNTADLNFPKDENSANILVERLRNVHELTQTPS